MNLNLINNLKIIKNKKEIKYMQEKTIIRQSFWVRTPVSLVLKNTITPEEYNSVVRIEGEYDDGSRFITQIEPLDKTHAKEN